MRFIVAVKNNVTAFRVQNLSCQKLMAPGDHVSMVSADEKTGRSLMESLGRQRTSIFCEQLSYSQCRSIRLERWKLIDGENLKEVFEISVPDVVRSITKFARKLILTMDAAESHRH